MSGPEFLHLRSGLIQVSDEQIYEVNRSEHGCFAVPERWRGSLQSLGPYCAPGLVIHKPS